MDDKKILNLIQEAKETPCMKCLEKAQAAHIACYVSAGDDAAKKTACDKALTAAIKVCPCP